MNFSQIRDQAISARQSLDALERMCDREWICPDKTKIKVCINPSWPEPEHAVSLFVERFVPQEGTSHTLRNGTVIEDGYYDHIHDAHRYLTSQQLRWFATARQVVEMWIAGGVNELPESLTF